MTGRGFGFLAVIFWPSLVFGIGNFLEMWVLTPWIHGRTTQLNPVMILTVVLIGGALAGFWGLLLSIPIAICLNIVFVEFGLPRMRDNLYPDCRIDIDGCSQHFSFSAA